MKAKLLGLLGTWGRPPDLPAKIAVALAVLLAVAAVTRRGRSLLGLGPSPLPRRLFLWIVAFAAALLSVAYIALYLRGGPRIIDATTYFLQGRALSEGFLAWPAGEPSASFRGRFLLFHDGSLGGLFPPGYPLLLTFGFALGAPMVVGPALAAALVLATYRLARTIASEAAPHDLIEPIARTAAILSLVSAALRYHTADTMSHGATALGIVLALDFALRAAPQSPGLAPSPGLAWAAGLAIGYVAATRPVSALAIALVVAALVGRTPRLLARVALGAIPGLALLLLAQHAVTGAWLTSSQRMYYATSDGPAGCFRWGFGAGTGCLFEHEDFVKDRLPGGYGVLEALGTTLRRLRMHLTDVSNLEPLALLPLAALKRPRARPVLAGLALVGLHVLAYAPFYFDGNYPGGGARFFADLLPVEHAIAAVAIARLAPFRFVRGAMAVLSLSLLGFGVHAAYEHEKLGARDGGRPMFEPDLLSRANVTAGLVFVDTDHGFALGHDPGARAKDGVVVARLRGDDRDWLLFDRLERPPSWQYRFDRATEPATAQLVPWSPSAPAPDSLRFEAEAEWPPLAQSGAFASPHAGDACASNGRALLVTPDVPGGRGTATLAIPVPAPGRYAVTIRVVHGAHLASREAPSPTARGGVTVGPLTAEWSPAGAGCSDLSAREITLSPPSAPVTVTATGGPVAVDVLRLKRLP
jgi:hypothetical protein